MKLAIIIGVSNYQYCNSLSACDNDASVMHTVFHGLNKFDDICLISNSPKAFEAKQKLTEFINKYKSKDVIELVFYYTGHGARYDDDFFYTFSDFKELRKEVTGLRNTELDGLIRNLNPELTVKIVDACYSGSAYVKSEIDIKPVLEKSAKENNLNKIYFFHSSSSDETSLATDSYSYFTYSFCKALIQNEGSIRYRDIMAYVADDMSENGYPKPAFIIQADNTEIFGEINVSLLNSTKSILKLESDNGEDSDEPDKDNNPNTSLIKLVQKISNEEYCTQEEAFTNIAIIRDSLELKAWPTNITDLFELEETELESVSSIPNEIEIGRWLHKNSKGGFFACRSYETEIYHVDEYKEIPKKPNSVASPISRLSQLTAAGFLGIDKDIDYKLEKVKKKREVIKGFEYSADTPYKAIRILFKPKFKAIENYCLTIALVFSRKTLILFSAREVLPYTSWEQIGYSKCTDWKVKSLKLKDISELDQYFLELISSSTSFICDDITGKLDS